MEARIKELEEENARLTQERGHIQAGLAQLQNSLAAVGLSFSAPDTALTSGTSNTTERAHLSETAIINKAQDAGDGTPQSKQVYSHVDPDAVQAIRLIMAHNDESTLHKDKWRISTDPLRVLLSQVGKCTTPKIMDAMKAMKTELDEHHQKHGLGQRHNRTHGGADKIASIISLNQG
ncbi:MAG: hypothetical protein F6K36_29660 [Symploca sp. SIO3C6]|nr:hypothetical protein [Symploca sp. SIO3C6]